ncbi:MAG: hypothetical protein ABFQ89_06100, partial [Chloroflexota bacterium]
ERRRMFIRDLSELSISDNTTDFDSVLNICLSDSDPDVKRLTISSVYESEEVTLIKPLLNVMSKESDTAIRASAADALGQFVLRAELGEYDPQIHDMLLHGLLGIVEDDSTEDLIRAKALESVAYVDANPVRDLISSFYGNESQILKTSAITAMGRSGDERYSSHILSELENEDIGMRYQAVVAAGELQLESASNTLKRVVVEDEIELRRSAMNSLAEIGNAHTLPFLSRFIDDLLLGDDAISAINRISLAGGSHGVMSDDEQAEEVNWW